MSDTATSPAPVDDAALPPATSLPPTSSPTASPPPNEGQITVTLIISATGRPEDAEALARATLRAGHVMAPHIVGKP